MAPTLRQNQGLRLLCYSKKDTCICGNKWPLHYSEYPKIVCVTFMTIHSLVLIIGPAKSSIDDTLLDKNFLFY
jgi:hypothetical protein